MIAEQAIAEAKVAILGTTPRKWEDSLSRLRRDIEADLRDITSTVVVGSSEDALALVYARSQNEEAFKALFPTFFQQ